MARSMLFCSWSVVVFVVIVDNNGGLLLLLWIEDELLGDGNESSDGVEAIIVNPL